ncbi:MAG: PfaD family polyunsaturated fatty acid/polyketide biosynthesis protein [Maricaulaceae bacterium]
MTNAFSVYDAVENFRRPVAVVRRAGEAAKLFPLDDEDLAQAAGRLGPDLIGVLPAIYPEWLGDRSFAEAHGCRFPYVVGEMARGIATPTMVAAAATAGFLGSYGSAGLSPRQIGEGVAEIRARLEQVGGETALESWSANLIHSPQEPGYERAVVDVLLKSGVARVSASAFMRMSPEIVRFAASGLSRAPGGDVIRTTHVLGKASRPEVARGFMSPPPEKMLADLVAAGDLTEAQADLARTLPIAEDITAEADSGGHTDNRPLSVLLPLFTKLRDELALEHGHGRRIRVGAAGGLATPQALAGAFQLGAAYVLTGSVNQSAAESGLSSLGRQMLAGAGPTDVAMAPAADMFERGVKVQVLSRGTMFAVNGRRLYELYRARAGLDDLSQDERTWVEGLMRETIEEAWAATRAFHLSRAPQDVEKAEKDPRYKMALVFRRYLFFGAQWAREGVADRHTDFQIWCGPAMGAFNDWVKGSFLEDPTERTVSQIGLNLLEGAARASRAQQLRAAGVDAPPDAARFAPIRIASERLASGPLTSRSPT